MEFRNYYRITTDDTLREIAPHGNGSYSFAYYLEDVGQFDFQRIDWHWHNEVEFMTVTEGSLRCLIGEDTIILSSGFGLFVNSGILHRFEALSERAIIPNIVFSPILLAPEESLIYEKYIFPVIHHAASYQVFNPQIPWQNNILHLLSQIYALQENKKNHELLTLQKLLSLWGILAESLEIPSEMHSEMSSARHVNHRQAKLRLMMQYIQDHYEKPLTLEEIAAAASISKSSALNIFQSGIHVSPVSYLIQYRLKCAGRLLCTTEKSVSIIAEETGFPNAGYFCRKFKEYYHMTPLAYRKDALAKYQ